MTGDFNSAVEWLNTKYRQPLSTLQQVHLASLEDQDTLCQKCDKQDDMLCSGLRRTFDLGESNAYNTLRIVSTPCHKLESKKQRDMWQSRLSGSMIPPAAIQEARKSKLPKVEVDELGEIYVDNVEIPRLSFSSSELSTTKHVFAIMVALADAGYKPKFLYPQWWYGHTWDWENLGFGQVHDCDLLFVERMDAKGGTDFARSEVFGAVQSRAANCLPTIVTMASSPVGRNDSENSLIQEILTWERLQKEQ